MRQTLLITLFLLLAECAFALSSARPIAGDPRIKIINYKANTVFDYLGHFEYQTIMEFADDEVIDTITMGVPGAWQIIPAQNRLYIKPIEYDSVTNMTIITNKRMYFFIMHADTAKSIDDEAISFVIKFVYPEQYQFNSIQNLNTEYGPDLSKPERYNFEYTIAGDSPAIEPLQVFDDGEFTYFKFKDVNSELPAIFKVNADNSEGLVNFRFQAGYMIVEMVWSRFTVRLGSDVICVYNKSTEPIKPHEDKSFWPTLF